MVLCNLEHEIIYMNPAAIKDYVKWGGADLIGRSLLACHNDKSKEMIKRVVDWFAADKDHNIVPKTIIKPIQEPMHMIDDKKKSIDDTSKMTRKQLELMIKNLTSEMNRAAKSLDFEEAARLRDEILELKAKL